MKNLTITIIFIVLLLTGCGAHRTKSIVYDAADKQLYAIETTAGSNFSYENDKIKVVFVDQSEPFWKTFFMWALNKPNLNLNK